MVAPLSWCTCKHSTKKFICQIVKYISGFGAVLLGFLGASSVLPSATTFAFIASSLTTLALIFNIIEYSFAKQELANSFVANHNEKLRRITIRSCVVSRHKGSIGACNFLFNTIKGCASLSMAEVLHQIETAKAYFEEQLEAHDQTEVEANQVSL